MRRPNNLLLILCLCQLFFFRADTTAQTGTNGSSGGGGAEAPLSNRSIIKDGDAFKLVVSRTEESVQGMVVVAVNSHGWTAGNYFDTDTKQGHGFVSTNGTFHPIDFPEATQTTVMGINNSGEIVGTYVDAVGGQHGFVLSELGFSTVDFPGATLTAARAINDSGKVAGIYFDATGRAQGFVLSQGVFITTNDPEASQVLPLTSKAHPGTKPAPTPMAVATPVPTPTPTQATPVPTPTTPASTPAETTALAPVLTPTNATGLPTPATTAQIFSAIEQRTGWQSCNSSDCAGGSGTGANWFAQNQTTPSLSGSSLEIFNSGVLADSLWWQKLGASNGSTNFLWDFYAQVDDSSTTAAQALEFDSFQFVGGYNFMFGSQCNLAAGKWDVWDEFNGQWVHTYIDCKKFEPNVWHHIQWYVRRISGTQNYTFVTLAVDGVGYSVNQTYAAKYVGWSDNVGVQYQLDVNATGNGYREWVDQSTLTIW